MEVYGEGMVYKLGFCSLSPSLHVCFAGFVTWGLAVYLFCLKRQTFRFAYSWPPGACSGLCSFGRRALPASAAFMGLSETPQVLSACLKVDG